jgi:hypothetical protein
MDIFLLQFIFPVWAAISFLFLLQAIISRCNVIWFMKCILSFLSQISYEVIQWMSVLAWKFISSYSGCFWLSILHWIFIVPIVLYTFFHGVYNFGPRHCQWSFIGILFNPVPGIEFERRTTESTDFDLLKHRCFNHNLTAQQIPQNKFLSVKRTTQSSIALVYNCPMANMNPIAQKLHCYQTYITFHNTPMEQQVMDSEKSIPMTLYFAICKFSCPEIVFSKLPWRPPDGFITSTFAMALIFSIFSVITICTCSWLCFT